MKKIISTFIFLTIYASIFAQYKKASFFSKEGRTYGIGAQLYNMGDGKGSVMGFNLTFGRNQDDKQWFNFWELRIIPSYDFSYVTTDAYANKATVTGKAKTHVIYAYNWGCFLLPDGGERIFRPYLTMGFNILILGGVKFDDANLDGFKMQPSPKNLGAGIGGGAGTFIRIGGNFALKIEGGYNYQANYSVDALDAGYEPYFMYTSHAYASVGIRYRLAED